MSDQFNNFSFDLQRFDGPSSVYYSLIDESSATKTADNFYWGASGPLLELSSSTSAIVQVNYATVETASGASTSYYSVTDIADWVSLAGASADYKFTSISGTEDFNIIGLGDNTVEGLNFLGNDGASVPTLNFSGAGDSSKDYLNIYNGALSNIALGTTSAALTVNDNSSSITWSINGQSLALNSNFTFTGDKTLELLGDGDDTVNFTYANAVNKISGLSSNTIDGLGFTIEGSGTSSVSLEFSGAGDSSNYLEIANGALSNIALVSTSAALTVNEKTYDGQNYTTDDDTLGLRINKERIAIDQGFKYSIEGESARTIEILAGGTSVVVADSGDANKITFGSKSYATLQFDSDTYEFENVSGSVYFAVNESKVNGFNFGGASDTLILNDKAIAILEDGTYLVGGSAIFNANFNLGGLNVDENTRTKKLVLNNKDTGEFLISGLEANENFTVAEDINIYFSDQYHSDRNPIGGGSVIFYAASGAIKEITVGASGILMI